MSASRRSVLLATVAVIGLVFAAIPNSAFAADPDELVWGGGQPAASAYSGKYVPYIIEQLDKARLSGYEWGGVSDGTAFNAEKVTDHPTHIGAGQLDILKRIKGKPILGREGVNYSFTVIKENLGPECLYLVTKDKNYTTLGHVVGNAWDVSIATGGEKSGSFGSLQVLQEKFPDLKDVTVAHVGGNDKIIEAVTTSKHPFGFFVMRPDPTNQIFKTIIDNGLTLVPVLDFELEDTYTFPDLKIANSGIMSDAVYHTTACTSVALITGDPSTVAVDNTRAKRRLEETIARMGALSSDIMLQEATAKFTTWRDYADSFRAVGSDQLAKLKQASANAFEAAKKKAGG